MFSILLQNLLTEILQGLGRRGLWCLALGTVWLTATVAPAVAQTSVLTEIYNSGVLTLGPDESLQLTIVNNNNVTDSALPNLPASDESCTIVAQFLDGNGNVLQKQQETLEPGQNLSLSQSGQSTVQARVDVSPGTSSGFAAGIANQCVVSVEILNTSSGDVALFPPLSQSVSPASSDDCHRSCANDCAYLCRPVPTPSGVRAICKTCIEDCRANCE